MVSRKVHVGEVQEYSIPKKQYKLEFTDGNTEDWHHSEFEGGVSASLRQLIDEKIDWDVQNDKVAQIFTFSKDFYNGLRKHSNKASKRFEALDPKDPNSAYTDGVRLQYYLHETELFCKPSFKYLVGEIEEKLRVLTGMHDYVVCNCVILNTNNFGWPQQMHADWCEGEGEDKYEKYFVLVAIDTNQTLNVYTGYEEEEEHSKIVKHLHQITEMRLDENKLFVGNQNCIHGGSTNLGRQLHGMFLPKDYNCTSQEAETLFLTSHKMYPE